MGYDYTILAWCRTRRPIDLSRYVDNEPFGWLMGGTLSTSDRSQDYLLVAQDLVDVNNDVIAGIRRVTADCGGYGLITINGEISLDGRDHTLLVQDGEVLGIPLRDVYDARTAWNRLYRATHYMSAPRDDLPSIDSQELAVGLLGLTRIAGFVEWRDDRWDEAAIRQAKIDAVLDACPSLRGSVRNQADFLLIGGDAVDAAAAVAALAAVLGTGKDYGVLYCSRPDDRQQVPVSIAGGRAAILPTISLDPSTHKRVYPVDHVYSGHGDGLAWVPLGIQISLYELIDRLAPLADPTAPPGWLNTLCSDPVYEFESGGLLCHLFATPARYSSVDATEWPFLLGAYLNEGPDPLELARRLEDLLGRIRALGVRVKPMNIAYGWRERIKVPRDSNR